HREQIHKGAGTAECVCCGGLAYSLSHVAHQTNEQRAASKHAQGDSKMKSSVIEALSLRASGHTTRWHTIHHLKRQTVSEHSAQALNLLLILHENPTVDLIKAVLWHDSAERVVGDLPAPALRGNPRLREEYKSAEACFFSTHDTPYRAFLSLSAEDQAWLRGVDILELYLWCHDEMML